jgi:hypothetical protein
MKSQADHLNLFCKLVLSQDQFGDTGTLIIDLVRVRLEARLDRFTYYRAMIADQSKEAQLSVTI